MMFYTFKEIMLASSRSVGRTTMMMMSFPRERAEMVGVRLPWQLSSLGLVVYCGCAANFMSLSMNPYGFPGCYCQPFAYGSAIVVFFVAVCAALLCYSCASRPVAAGLFVSVAAALLSVCPITGSCIPVCRVFIQGLYSPFLHRALLLFTDLGLWPLLCVRVVALLPFCLIVLIMELANMGDLDAM